MKLKFANALSLALIVAMLFTSVGLADNLQGDDLVAGNNASKQPGQAGTAAFFLQPNGPDGCNANSSNPVTVTVTSSQAWLTIDAPGTVSLSGCGNANTGTIGYSVATNAPVGGIAVVTGIASGGIPGNNGFNNTSGDFNVAVIAPPVQNQAINVTQAAPASAVYGSSFNVAATGGGSGNPVVITSSGACTGGGNNSALITMISGTGTCTVTYNQAGATGYNAAPQVTSNTAAQKADATVVVNGYSGAYDGAPHGATGSATGVGGADLSASLSLGASYTDVSGGLANWSFAGGDNYLDESGSVSIVISQVSSSTVVTFEAAPYVYRGTPYTATATVTGVNLSQSLDVEYSGDCTNVTDTDGCTASATFDGDTNHTGSSDSKSITISKAPVTAAAGGGSGTYTGFAQAPADCAVTGAYTGDLTCTNDPTSVGPDAGVYPIAPVVAGTGLGNFDITSVPGSYEILKADADCDVDGFTGTYDGQPHGATGTCTGVNNEDLSAGLSFDTSFTDYPGGTVHWTFDGGTNYNDQEGDVDIVINKAPVTATAGSGSTTYDGATHSPSPCVVSGAYTGDLTCANNPASVGPNAGTTAIVPVVSGTGLGNFEITPVNGSYTINKADATINVSGFTGYYDGACHGATGTATGVLGEDLSAGLNLGACFTNVPGGTANWSFSGGTNYNNANGSVAIVINAWTLTGFYQPVDMGNVFNTVRNGSTVPLKFEIFAGSTELTNTASVKSLTYVVAACDATFGIDEIETTATGGTVLRYDATSGQFIFNWKTPTPGGKCYRVTMEAQDGSKLIAFFKLK